MLILKGIVYSTGFCYLKVLCVSTGIALVYSIIKWFQIHAVLEDNGCTRNWQSATTYRVITSYILPYNYVYLLPLLRNNTKEIVWKSQSTHDWNLYQSSNLNNIFFNKSCKTTTILKSRLCRKAVWKLQVSL